MLGRAGFGDGVPIKDIDEALHEIDELLERWENRLSIDKLALAERYRENKLHLVVVWISVLPGKPHEYHATFECAQGNGSLERHGWHGDRFFPAKGALHGDVPLDLVLHGKDGKQELMLVENIKLMEIPERFIPSIVRLESAKPV